MPESCDLPHETWDKYTDIMLAVMHCELNAHETVGVCVGLVALNYLIPPDTRFMDAGLIAPRGVAARASLNEILATKSADLTRDIFVHVSDVLGFETLIWLDKLECFRGFRSLERCGVLRDLLLHAREVTETASFRRDDIQTVFLDCLELFVVNNTPANSLPFVDHVVNAFESLFATPCRKILLPKKYGPQHLHVALLRAVMSHERDE